MKSFAKPNQEIIRHRYYAGQCDYKRGIGTLEAAQRGKYIMEESGLSPQDRPVVKAALEKEAEAKSSSSSLYNFQPAKSLQGKQSDTMTASAAYLPTALKN